MSEAENDARRARLQLKSALEDLVSGKGEEWKRVDAVLYAVDDLIAVRIAEFAELMADRFEVKMVDIREALKE